ncbi:MAG: hypothetical protein D3911_12510 [Candidatus Electrothrix sp. AW3_4]|nr:hypothetical protein [Candidatus Electrothrix gigas]
MDSDSGGFLPIKQAELEEQITKASAFLRRAAWHPKVKATPLFFQVKVQLVILSTLLYPSVQQIIILMVLQNI